MVSTFTIPASAAEDRQEADQLVEKARFTLDGFMSDKNMEAFRDLIKKAKGIYIAPQVLKGAFIIGASGGTGVLVAQDEKTGTWSGPAFYTVGGASFGLQIGGQASEVILLAMTDRGVIALLSNSVKLGADVGLAAGPIGAGVSASSANFSVDILSFSRSKGLYGGVSLDGAVVAVRDSLNSTYYGKKVTPADILIRRDVTHPKSSGLIESVTKATGK
jgi:lipid-binding SYLF domain-containing protein